MDRMRWRPGGRLPESQRTLVFVDGDFDHFDGRRGTVFAVGPDVFDFLKDVHASDHAAEHGMFGVTRREEVEERVMGGVDEKLA